MGWVHIGLGYAVYLCLLAWGMSRFRRARVPAAAVTLATGAIWWAWPAVAGREDAAGLALRVVVPGLALLAAYRVSGSFFVAPDRRLERWLLRTDEAMLDATGVLGVYTEAPHAIREAFELMYLLVYAVLPLGALTLILGGASAALEPYWTVVFGAELACYAMLPWLQSRPPRAIEPARSVPPPGPLRRLNGFVLQRGSIQVNTIPSGHAAGAFAIALAVSSVLPGAGAAFLVLAIGITLATVLGRYHYLIDSVLGVAVGVAAWVLLG